MDYCIKNKVAVFGVRKVLRWQLYSFKSKRVVNFYEGKDSDVSSIITRKQGRGSELQLFFAEENILSVCEFFFCMT